MKKLGSIVSTVLIAALVLAVPAAAVAAGKTHEMKGKVVSIDTKANTMTFTDEKGESHTAPLLDKAIKEAAALKAGEEVTVTCQDTEKGEHQGIAGITKVKKG
jgi:ribosomal protein S1